MEKLVKGSIEVLPVEITDRLGTITSLDTHGCTYKVDDENDTNKIAWTSCNSEGMIALPLIDTSTLEKLIHKLYVRVDVAPEYPILGPFEFEVI